MPLQWEGTLLQGYRAPRSGENVLYYWTKLPAVTMMKADAVDGLSLCVQDTERAFLIHPLATKPAELRRRAIFDGLLRGKHS